VSAFQKDVSPQASEDQQRLCELLDRKTREASEMAAELASHQRLVSDLRHEVNLQMSLRDREQRQRWQQAEAADEDLWRMVHGMAHPLATLLKSDAATAWGTKGERGAAAWGSDGTSTPSTASGLASCEPASADTPTFSPYGAKGGSTFLQWAFSM